MQKSYRELSRIKTFDDRLKYLILYGTVGEATFGGHRMLNQLLYRSYRWKRTRRDIIIRDEGYDLGIKTQDHLILGNIYVHHINPITIEDLLNESKAVFDPDNLISVSFSTHNKIHYGIEERETLPMERRPNDTCPWK